MWALLLAAPAASPAAGYWFSSSTERAEHQATLLEDGRVLVTGGVDAPSAFVASPSAELYDPVRGSFSPAGSMNDFRVAHQATRLDDGRVLITGGSDGGGELATAEIYDPATGTFTPTGSMTAARADHQATLLQNGKVLITGGSGGGASALSSAELYNPGTGVFTAVSGGMGASRSMHQATVLGDGKVLLSGGNGGGGAVASAELYAPQTNTFAATGGAMTGPRLRHQATRLAGGKVLISGGTGSGGPVASAELYDPAAGTFAATTGSMAAARTEHGATLLASGKVLLSGGHDGTDPLSSAELYDPDTSSFSATTGGLATARNMHRATLLESGRVIVTGGYGADPGSGIPVVAASELYDPSSATFSARPAVMGTERQDHAATLLANGKVLVTGGMTMDGTIVATAELYDPATGLFAATGSMNHARRQHQATLLQSGKVLVTGGQASGGGTLAKAETYDPATGAFTEISDMTVWRRLHQATLLASGKVLITGGRSGSANESSAELYDPAAVTPFTATADPGAVGSATMSTARHSHAAVRLQGGKVLITGGTDSSPTDSADLYDPATDSFSATDAMEAGRRDHQATLLDSGKVLITGGNLAATTSAELYDPAAGTFSATAGGLAMNRTDHTATLLAGGKVLVAGGGGNVDSLNSSELYDPVTGTFSSTITSLVSQVSSHRATRLQDGNVLLTGGARSTARADGFGGPARTQATAQLFRTDDTAAPVTGDDVPAGWRSSAVAVTLDASDTGGAGLHRTYYTVGSSPADPTTGSAVYNPASKPTLANGQRIKYFSTDVAGNAEAVKTSAPAQVDSAAPATTDDVPSGWRTGPVAVTLSASDTGGSGVDRTYYTTGAAPPDPTTSSSVYNPASKPTLANGERIKYFSVDQVGRTEAVKTSAAAQVDTAAPVTTDDVPSAAQAGPATVTLSATDSGGSGLDKTYYTTGAAPPDPTTSSSVYNPASKPTLANGERIKYFSTDVAGNAEAVKASPALSVSPPPGDDDPPGDGDGGELPDGDGGELPDGDGGELPDGADAARIIADSPLKVGAKGATVKCALQRGRMTRCRVTAYVNRAARPLGRITLSPARPLARTKIGSGRTSAKSAKRRLSVRIRFNKAGRRALAARPRGLAASLVARLTPTEGPRMSATKRVRLRAAEA